MHVAVNLLDVAQLLTDAGLLAPGCDDPRQIERALAHQIAILCSHAVSRHA